MIQGDRMMAHAQRDVQPPPAAAPPQPARSPAAASGSHAASRASQPPAAATARFEGADCRLSAAAAGAAAASKTVEARWVPVVLPPHKFAHEWAASKPVGEGWRARPTSFPAAVR